MDISEENPERKEEHKLVRKNPTRNLSIVVMGGDNCANNALVHNITRYAKQEGIVSEVYAVKNGINGLLNEVKVESISYAEINPEQSGYKFGVSREPICFMDTKNLAEYCAKTMDTTIFTNEEREEIRQFPHVEQTVDGKTKRIYTGGITDDKTLKCINERRAKVLAHNLVDVLESTDVLFIGGDGTMRAVRQFIPMLNQLDDRYRKLRVHGVVSTMDNNCNTKTNHNNIQTAVCSGYPSALSKTIEEASGLVQICKSGQRVLFCETMGGLHAGWVTAATALGGAKILVTNEIIEYFERNYGKTSESETSTEEFEKQLFSRVEKFLGTDHYVILGIFEPSKCPKNGVFTVEGYSESGSRSFGAAAAYQEWCLEKFAPEKQIYASYHSCGYGPKIGQPSAYDKRLAEVIGMKQAEILASDQSGMFPALKDVVTYGDLDVSRIQTIPIMDVEDKPTMLPEAYLDHKFLTVTRAFEDFARMLRSSED